ncbi:MAG: hypothetical protein GC154_11385 [bacterium]|nr:hypothetical protein [bacterium]
MRFVFSMFTLACCTIFAAGSIDAAAPGGAFHLYTSLNPNGFSVITADQELPILLYLQSEYGLIDAGVCDPPPRGILAQVIYANGRVIDIPQASAGTSTLASPLQDEAYPAGLDACGDLNGAAFPYAIVSADLPYSQTFDVTASTDSGDYRGGAADSISRPGGHDGFWTFTPGASGAYLITLGATRGESAPIPGHELPERGFGGVGVWTGECGSLTELKTATSIIGDSQIAAQLEAGVTYTVIWEDYYVGSTENSVTLSIEALGEASANDIMDAIDLNEIGWGFHASGDTTANADLEISGCIEPVEGEGHGSGGNALSGADIWYRLPSTQAGEQYVIEITPGDGPNPVIDTVISLHAYNLNTHQVSEVTCVDDTDEGERLAPLSFTAEAGLIYYVMIETKPAYDQLPFGQFTLSGRLASETSSAANWLMY